MNRVRAYLFLAVGLICLSLLGCNQINRAVIDDQIDADVHIDTDDSADKVEQDDNNQLEDIGQVEDITDTAIQPVNNTVSVYSWHFELSNIMLSDIYISALKEIGVNRVYQNVSTKIMNDTQIRYLISKLSCHDMETVALMGDKSWVNDGLGEYYEIVDAICNYNETVNDDQRISKLALDVEAHLLPEWDKSEKKVFKEYISVMKDAKEYASEKGLGVIAVIPTYYDEVSSKLFEEFLEECCDEISVMNYAKDTADRAISTEYELCTQMEIPIETVFETMPDSEEYGVNSSISYYEDGLGVLSDDVNRIKRAYGNDLGVAYHQLTSLFSVMTGKRICEIDLDGYNVSEPEPVGVLLLYAQNGGVYEAFPYWPKGRKSESGFRYLCNIDKTDISYRIVKKTLHEEKEIADEAYFESDGNTILVMKPYSEE